MYFKKTPIILFIFFYLHLFSQSRSLYVDNFNSILGNDLKEHELLSFAKSQNFNSLILYELHRVNKRMPLADVTQNNVLASFIYRAKKEYDIEEISGSGESGGFFINVIDAYNKTRTKLDEKFNAYNLEYEYWKKDASDLGGYYCENYLRKNGIPCNRRGSFNYYLESLSIMKLLANESKQLIKVQAYVGQYNNKEIRQILKYTDQVLISAYARTAKKSFTVSKKMLRVLAACRCNVETSIILSAEHEYMGGYLNYNSLKIAEKEFIQQLKSKDMSVWSNVNFIHFTYYNYSYVIEAVKNETFRRTGLKKEYKN
ncbi:hypothetical protein [Polaribacter sp. IC063]|uniref:hypothetical protein n=1 Tax=Polaribacter sp. IC063 TaxID=57031 RepID=UPI0011BDE8B5|nr:hypothetical protein [Polaribacter sp. IC063]TXD52569.1 hypothetical protein ES043_07760 [Polaribacter sp. IC063]